jgi:hypothetical protein
MVVLATSVIVAEAGMAGDVTVGVSVMGVDVGVSGVSVTVGVINPGRAVQVGAFVRLGDGRIVAVNVQVGSSCIIVMVGVMV